MAGRCALRSPAAHLGKGRGGPPSAARLLALQLPPQPGPAAGSSLLPVSPARRRGPGAGAFPFGLTVHTQVLERCRAHRTDTHMNGSATARPGPAGLLQTLSDLPFPCHWTYRLLLVGRLQTSLPDRGSSCPMGPMPWGTVCSSFCQELGHKQSSPNPAALSDSETQNVTSGQSHA